MKANGIDVEGQKFRVTLEGRVASPHEDEVNPVCSEGPHHRIFDHRREADYISGHIVCCTKRCGRRYKIIAINLPPQNSYKKRMPPPTTSGMSARDFSWGGRGFTRTTKLNERVS